MASQERINQLKDLVLIAGSIRKAEQLIKNVKGVAPTNSAIHKAMQTDSKTTDYIVQSYITDLEIALSKNKSR